MLEIVGLILLGLFAGSLAATLGVGVGIIFVPILVSVFGFTQLDAQGTYESLLKSADAALYRAKDAGRNTVAS